MKKFIIFFLFSSYLFSSSKHVIPGILSSFTEQELRKFITYNFDELKVPGKESDTEAEIAHSAALNCIETKVQTLVDKINQDHVSNDGDKISFVKDSVHCPIGIIFYGFFSDSCQFNLQNSHSTYIGAGLLKLEKVELPDEDIGIAALQGQSSIAQLNCFVETNGFEIKNEVNGAFLINLDTESRVEEPSIQY